MQTSGTDAPLAVPFAVGLDRLRSDDLRRQAGALGIAAPRGERELRTTLAQTLADRAFLARGLHALPPMCGLVVEALCEVGGALNDSVLAALVARRTGCARELATAAIWTLVEAGLLWPLRAHGRIEEAQCTLPAEASPALYALTRGLAWPEAPSALRDDDPQTVRRGRDAILLAVLTLHRSVRLTQTAAIDRTTLKKLLRGLGQSEDPVSETLRLALSLGLVRYEEDWLVPDVPRLLAFAKRPGTGAKAGPGASFAAAVRADSWTPCEVLVALQMREAALQGNRCVDASAVSSEAEVAERLHVVPGLCFAEHGGRLFAKWCAPREPRGDGHVTPSFEVMLGPQAELSVAATVALGCELQRLDHVATLRLSRESVQRALGAGVDADALRRALAAVGPHGLPPNVQVMLDDWIGGHRSAVLGRGVFLFLAPDVADRVAGALGPLVTRRPAPGVLELVPHVARGRLLKQLERTGVALADSGAAPSVGTDAAEPAPAPTPAPELRARLERARKEKDWGELVRRAKPGHPAPHRGPPARGGPRPVPSSSAADHDEKLALALGLLRELAAEVREELRHWSKRLDPITRREVERAFEEPTLLLPWVLLTEKWRRRTLRDADDLHALAEAAGEVVMPSRLSPRGQRFEDATEGLSVQRALAQRMASALVDTGMAASKLDELPDEVLAHLAEHVGRMLDEPEPAVPPQAAASLGESVADLAPHVAAVAARMRDRAAMLAQRPAPGALRPLPPKALRELLERAAASSAIVHLRLANDPHSMVRSMVAEAVRTRGSDSVLLGVDVESEESRVVRLQDVVAAASGAGA